MKIGDYITSKSYVEKGKGRIIDIIENDDGKIISVSSDKTMKTWTV